MESSEDEAELVLLDTDTGTVSKNLSGTALGIGFIVRPSSQGGGRSSRRRLWVSGNTLWERSVGLACSVSLSVTQ